MVFWTRDGQNLVRNAHLLEAYKKRFHFTLTGWHEVEKKAPDIKEGLRILADMVSAFGAENIVWRFSPIPTLIHVNDRFKEIADGVQKLGIKAVYLSFLQNNDLMQDPRGAFGRQFTLAQFAKAAPEMNLLLCNEDRADLPQKSNVRRGICEDGAWAGSAQRTEGCGCALAVDPFTVNESCVFGCQYCLDPDTPILYADMVWRPIGEAQPGDVLLAFDEDVPNYRVNRKFRETVIEKVWFSDKPTIRFDTERGSVVTTAEHRWLAGSTRRWKPTSAFNLQTDVYRLGDVTPDLSFTEDYQVGYLAGITQGDGTFPQAYWRIALADEEPLKRLVSYLGQFGIEGHIRPFDPGVSGFAPLNPRPMQKVEIRALGSLSRIHDFMNCGIDSDEYHRGFLAGIFDAEGSHSSNLRIHQTKNAEALFAKIERGSARFGLQFEPESSASSCRLVGGTRDKIKFFSVVRPAIKRKSSDIIGRSLECLKDPVVHLEKGPVKTVVDIQTSTGTFFAAGLATHNCYAADKELAPKKRNTTKHLPLVR